MTGMLRRRTVRHLLVGVLPVLVVGAAVVAVLLVRLAAAQAPLRDATATADGTVVRSRLPPTGDGVLVRWNDARGLPRESTVVVPSAGDVSPGRQVVLRYVPSDPGRVYVGGDATSVRLRDLAYGVFTVAFAVLLVLGITSVHVLRRLVAERRPGTTLPVTYARSRRGLVQRSWLVVEEAGREWWVPVHWAPPLASLLARTPCPVHGKPSAQRVLVVEVRGEPVWQALGRRRAVPPRGQVWTATTPWSKGNRRKADEQAAGGRPAALSAQLRTDAVLVLAAPLLGVLWAFANSGGMGGAAAATATSAAILFWLPSVYGSDPT